MRLLIVDDDQKVSKALSLVLKHAYEVDVATTAEQGELLATTNDYDLLILDRRLPDKSGITLSHLLRREQLHVPILMISGLTDVEQKVTALDNGVDDYLVKPFSTAEFLARVRALLRRSPLIIPQSVMKLGEVTINLSTAVVSDAHHQVSLRKKELQILEILLHHHGQTVSRQILLDHVWCGNKEPCTNCLEVHIEQLRRKMAPFFANRGERGQFIKTVYGFGYRLIW